MLIKLKKSIIIRTSSDIQHQAQLWLQILADTLEEPTMRINFAVITVLHAEADMEAPSFEHVFTKANIPGCYLEDVQQITWYIFVCYRFIHDVS